MIGRLRGRVVEGERIQITPEDRQNLYLERDLIHSHPILRVNYTSYDLQRLQDIVRPETHPFIILHSNDDVPQDGAAFHPFWYARVLGIYHAMVRDHRSISKELKRINFLWVRWLVRDPNDAAGWDSATLDHVQYLDSNEPETGPFGFLDPEQVIRGAHLIPAFNEGRTTDFAPANSVAADRAIGRGLKGTERELQGDWCGYYVNR